MNKIRSMFAFLCVALVLSLAAAAPFLSRTAAQSVAAPGGSAGAGPSTTDGSKLVYPPTKKVEHFDDYFGTKVPDPYRWLEDETSADTKAWVDDQNRVTFAYLEKIPYREKLKARLTELYNYPRISAPFRRGETMTESDARGVQHEGTHPWG